MAYASLHLYSASRPELFFFILGMHQYAALTPVDTGANVRLALAERVGPSNIGQTGVWDRKSGDRIRGYDGTRIHAVDSLAGADG